MMRALGTIFVGLLGLAFGSFLNVCVSRWPVGESIVRPRSHCRRCGHALPWWENLPLASWLALRGRCARCHAWIGWRYPLVELAVGALWTLPAWRFLTESLDPSLPVALVCFHLVKLIGTLFLLWLLAALAVLDAENLWLPDRLTLSGAAIGFALFLGQLFSQPRLASPTELPWTSGIERVPLGLYGLAFQRLLGIAAAAGLLVLIRWIYWLVRRREGLGLGDAKLMALLAAWLGLPGALLAFAWGVVLGSLTALASLAMPAKPGQPPQAWAATRLPLGTFLCVGGAVSSLWGQQMVAVYLRWCGF